MGSKIIRLLIFIIGILILRWGNIFSQDKIRSIVTETNNKGQTESENQIKSIFQDVENGITSGAIDLFSKHLMKHAYINLQNSESGYYSVNQAIYILNKYFSTRKIINFKFTTLKSSEDIPYATGGGYWIRKGKQEILQIYISLYRHENRWMIEQINVY